MTENINLDFVLIPGGEFNIGSDPARDRNYQQDEIPMHRLSVSDFYIMRHSVTNEQYQIFLQATGHRKPLFWKDGEYPADKADHPVVGVSFHDALAFCKWARETIGLPVRLPTEPEWEKAARGSDGRLYPWGEEWEADRCNSRESKVGDTSPVGSFSPNGDSPFGIADMAGNVQQWLANSFGPYPYDPQDGREEMVYEMDRKDSIPRIHETGCTSIPQSMEAALDKSVIRGGSWRESKLQSRCAYRSWAAPMHRSDDTGFRCCYEK